MSDEMNLEIFQVNVAILLRDSELQHANARLRYDPVYQGLIFELTRYIFRDEIKTIEEKYPKTWWDAFKDRWFYKWMKKYWPPQFTIVKLTAEVFYPYIPVPEQKHSYHLKKKICE